MLGFWIFGHDGALLTSAPADELLYGLVKSLGQMTLSLSSTRADDLVATPPLKCLRTGRYTLQIQSSLSGKTLVVALRPDEPLLGEDTLGRVLAYAVKNPGDVCLETLNKFEL